LAEGGLHEDIEYTLKTMIVEGLLVTTENFDMPSDVL
jgi:hypothetical protein